MRTTEPTAALAVYYAFAPQDEPLRQELEKHLSLLQRRGIIATWHPRLLPAGSEWEKEIDAHLETADLILLLISADFLASDYCYSQEMHRALERRQAGAAQVIPILLRPVDWQHEPALSKLAPLPANAEPVTSWPGAPTYDAAFAQIAQGIRSAIEERRKHPFTAGVGSKPTPLWNVPYRRNAFFTGREDLLKQLHERLSAKKATALTQAIGGLGGIGKTQIALEYAYQYREAYRVIWWVRAASRETLLLDLVALATELQLTEPSEADPLKVVALVKAWLATHKQWLLILDNAHGMRNELQISCKVALKRSSLHSRFLR